MKQISDLKTDVKSRLRIEDEMRSDGVEFKQEGRNLVACCPMHGERTPSFKVQPDEQFFKCFGCGESGDVLSWIAFILFKKIETTGAEFAAVLKEACRRAHMDFPDASPPVKQTTALAKPRTIYPSIGKLREATDWRAKEHGQTVTQWNEYTNPITNVVELVTIRLEKDGGKQFMQASPVSGGYIFSGLAVNPIFNRKLVSESQTVVLVEGEKCVRELRNIGIVATTSPGGAKAGIKADWSPLAGKTVTIWPDNDGPGKGYAADVMAALQKLVPVPTIRLIDPEPLKLGDGGDVVDFLATCGGDPIHAIVQVLDAAHGIGPLAELDGLFADAIAGRRYAVPLCWPGISAATRALLPGTVTILCGGPGATKSLSLVQNLTYWMRGGVKAIANMLEDGVAYHLRRAMAQISEKSVLTDDEWCKANPGMVAEMQTLTRAEIQSLSAYIDAPPRECDWKPEYFLNWIQTKCTEGYRVLAIDPITAMSKGQRSFDDDQQFMLGAKAILEQHGASLMLVTHPRKDAGGSRRGGGQMALSDLAGGAAYERFAQAVIYLGTHKPKELLTECSFGRQKVTANRTVSIFKARNSYGTGDKFAMDFKADSLTLHELGKIIPEES